ATATDKDGNTVYAEVDVNTRHAIVSSTTIYTVNETIDEAWVLANVALNATATEIEALGNNQYKLISDGNEVTIEIIQIEEEIGFIDLPETMYTRNGGYLPTVGNLLTGEAIEDAIFEVSDNTVLEIEDVTGLLVPLKAGEATVRATIGSIVIEKVVSVRENPIAFELDLSSADGKLGIQLTRTWGQFWLDESGNLTRDYTFGLYDDNNKFDVEWVLSNPEYATLTPGEGQNVVMNFTDAVRGNSVTLTAYLKINNRLVDRVKRSFTFNVKEKDAVNVYSWQQFRRVVDLRRYDIVMQSNVICTEETGISSSVFGNGFAIDCSSYPLDTSDFRSSALNPGWSGGGHYEWQETGTGTMVFEDIVAIGSTAYHGVSDYVFGFVDCYWMWSPIAFRYCQISGFNEGIHLHNCIEATVEGCIIGDNINCGIDVRCEPGRAEPIVLNLKNNVFKNSGGASIQLVTSLFDGRIAGKTMDVEVNVEGFMDIYNWKERSEFSGIFANTVLGLLGNDIVQGQLRGILADAVSGVIESFIFGEAYNQLFYRYAGKEYASLGIFGIGLIAKTDLNKVSLERESEFAKFIVPLSDENGNPVGTLNSVQSLLDLIIKQSGFSISNDCYLVCPNFSTAEPKIKPGDPVPNSKELYAQLQGTLA
ncbi:MAG: right-handed parallel beta-helix repeat-containing protein, partial [Clostridia bacterium]|nr:right-handed parallel beta-helix repeat-containing protein [Clostridia bacterium]